jgi:hypothetical protein
MKVLETTLKLFNEGKDCYAIYESLAKNIAFKKCMALEMIAK